MPHNPKPFAMNDENAELVFLFHLIQSRRA